jgi:hypothetical protein
MLQITGTAQSVVDRYGREGGPRRLQQGGSFALAH